MFSVEYRYYLMWPEQTSRVQGSQVFCIMSLLGEVTQQPKDHDNRSHSGASELFIALFRFAQFLKCVLRGDGGNVVSFLRKRE